LAFLTEVHCVQILANSASGLVSLTANQTMPPTVLLNSLNDVNGATQRSAGSIGSLGERSGRPRRCCSPTPRNAAGRLTTETAAANRP
jgi:crotonobetainyl-CoA:carnitine CoA-transferase CaiB-like acyl-CoA transferase